MDPRIAIFAAADTPAEYRTQIDAMECDAWPSDPANSTTGGHDPRLNPTTVVLVADTTVMAALTILSKTLVHAGDEYRAGGLSAVVTLRSARRQGHGARLVETVRGLMSDHGFDLGLFTCDRSLCSFYERAGWEVLPDTVVVGGTPDAPFPSDQPGFDKVAFGGFFSDRARADRQSFDGARIGLYPGPIDKLW
jgi:aminoglycoside 2'-N-acetyltransferase I